MQSLETAREIPRRRLPWSPLSLITQLLLSWDVLGTSCRLFQVFFPLRFFERILCVVLGGNLLGFFSPKFVAGLLRLSSQLD